MPSLFSEYCEKIYYNLKIPFSIFILGCCFVAVLCFQRLNAQEAKEGIRPGISIETKIHYGFIARHHPEMAVMSDIHFPVFELSISKQTLGNKTWEQVYDYPETGISLWQCNFANSSIVGSAIALYPFIRFPLLRKEPFALNARFGLGLGFFSTKFDRLENYKNLAIGSHLNAIINMMVESNYRLGNRFTISAGISLTHFSTGTIKFPNYGINVPAVNLGLAYNISKSKQSLITKDLPEPDRSWEYLVIASTGIKEISAIENKKYFIYNISGDLLKSMSLKYKIGGGIDLFYDNSKADALGKKGIYDNNFNSNGSLGLHFTYDQEISHLSILLELGTYLYEKHNIDGNIYEKLLINYFITSRFLVSTALKAHYAKADYITWGVGYRI